MKQYAFFAFGSPQKQNALNRMARLMEQALVGFPQLGLPQTWVALPGEEQYVPFLHRVLGTVRMPTSRNNDKAGEKGHKTRFSSHIWFVNTFEDDTLKSSRFEYR
ncbi:hypothetical protein CO180_01025 [candidate division WWE3 bacterium CG_4_9_14_3_um_filter_41_6]|uniref:Uncharacterized protein n=1 Tax=candidate division WWE3 bacterium CG_4_10_14_0_2_um_filter_41_14 TaxID=1975072 RepID=A0A2M7TIR6_UNCKA|nr:MAG: hypothetical protein COY32_03465 [candidate division WWE3 bacterium CG_4_10_14_0_2_um_filter_41_14]PJA39313.1 MAG: hypothetical protein CO180_01025 [candidate division WWE3 bacterium CG_4_9_14_3_um_filter_41_6]